MDLRSSGYSYYLQLSSLSFRYAAVLPNVTVLPLFCGFQSFKDSCVYNLPTKQPHDLGKHEPRWSWFKGILIFVYACLTHQVISPWQEWRVTYPFSFLHKMLNKFTEYKYSGSTTTPYMRMFSLNTGKLGLTTYITVQIHSSDVQQIFVVSLLRVKPVLEQGFLGHTTWAPCIPDPMELKE